MNDTASDTVSNQTNPPRTLRIPISQAQAKQIADYDAAAKSATQLQQATLRAICLGQCSVVEYTQITGFQVTDDAIVCTLPPEAPAQPETS